MNLQVVSKCRLYSCLDPLKPLKYFYYRIGSTLEFAIGFTLKDNSLVAVIKYSDLINKWITNNYEVQSCVVVSI